MDIVAVALALSPVAARAASTGPEFGLRAGYSVPFGDSLGDGSGNATPLKDTVTGGIPVWVDLGYRFTPAFYGGLFGSYGFLFPNGCNPGDSCSARNLRLGLDLVFHLAAGAPIDPWVGVGVGYEWLFLSLTTGGLSQDLTLRGFEFLDLQLGADFVATPAFRFGPFASFSLARYSEASTSGALANASGEIGDKKLHEWLLVGLRATFIP